MTTTYIPYRGKSSQGTWKVEGNRLTAETLRLARGENTAFTADTDGTRKPADMAAEKTASRKWLIRSVIWFVGVMVMLYTWNGFVSAQSRTTSYRVKSGDTLWSVAKHEMPKRDPRSVISKIQRLNHISGTDYIYPGEVLILPQK